MIDIFKLMFFIVRHPIDFMSFINEEYPVQLQIFSLIFALFALVVAVLI